MTKKGSIFEKEKKPEVVDEPDEFLELDEHEGTHEEAEYKIRTGDKDADVYTEEGREDLEGSDEVSPWEEGFSEGAEIPEHAICSKCEKPIGDRAENVIETEIKGKVVLFCSEKCAKAGMKKKA